MRFLQTYYTDNDEISQVDSVGTSVRECRLSTLSDDALRFYGVVRTVHFEVVYLGNELIDPLFLFRLNVGRVADRNLSEFEKNLIHRF
jgi:hypothetical protein